MLSIDTNILIRFIVHDDRAQTRKVDTLFAQLEKDHKQAFVPSLVILEVMWVLSFSFQVNRMDIIETLLEILKIPVLKIEHGEELKELLNFAVHNTLDLSDLMIAYRCRVENALPVMTFDKKASRNEMFKLLQ